MIEENSNAIDVGTLSVRAATSSVTFSVSNTVDWSIVNRTTLQRNAGRPINFETLPNNNKTISVEVVAKSLEIGAITETVEISVTDINEPATHVTISNLTVAENDVGALIGLLSADDPDANQVLTFAIQNAGGTTGPLALATPNRVTVAPGTALDFEHPPTSLVFTATVKDQGLLGPASPTAFTITISDRNDPTIVSTWIPTKPLSIAQADAPTRLASPGIEVFSDEDAAPAFRDFNNKHLKLSVTLPNSGLSDQFIVLDAAGAALPQSTDQVVIAGRPFTFSRRTFGQTREVDVITPATGTTLADLTEVLQRVAYQPDPAGLTSRADLSVVLALDGNPSQNRPLILNRANLAPRMNSVVPLTVKRFTQVAITPALLGITDDHLELGLTLSVDYPPANGDLLSGSPARILKANDLVEIVQSGTPATLKLDLIYVPRTSSAEEADTCFISLRDHGAVAGAGSGSFLSSGFTKLALTITQPDVPSISPVIIGATCSEGQAAAVSLIPGTATLKISGIADTSAISMGTWDLYVAYANLHPASGPAAASEQLLVVPPSGSAVIQEGSSFFLPTTTGSRRLIATTDGSLTGNGQALLVHFTPEATGADAVQLARSLAYRDASNRFRIGSETRNLFLGFIAKGASLGPQVDGVTRLISSSQVTITRIGVDDPPHFLVGPAITIATTAAAQIRGTSVMVDPDTAAVSSFSLIDSGGRILTGQPLTAGATVDAPDGFRLTIPWILPATTTPQDRRSFTLTATIGGRSLSQLITVVPLATPDGSFAIVSDAPLALIKTPPGSEPLRRRIRLERDGKPVSGATFYLVGEIPQGLTLDAAGAALVYDLATMPTATYRFSLLAAMGVGEALVSVEQPTVLRVIAGTAAN